MQHDNIMTLVNNTTAGQQYNWTTAGQQYKWTRIQHLDNDLTTGQYNWTMVQQDNNTENEPGIRYQHYRSL